MSKKAHLEDDENNIIIYKNKTPLFCNKLDFLHSSVYNRCVYKKENKTLNFSKMLTSKEYVKVYDEKYVTDRNHLKTLFEGNDRIFYIKKVGVDQLIEKKEFISYDTDKDYLSKRKYLKHYSFGWDNAINFFLRKGDVFFNHSFFQKNWDRFINPEEEEVIINIDIDIPNPTDKDVQKARKSIVKHIDEIDQCFFLYAPPNENKEFFVYRGMKGEYIDKMKVGDVFEIPNYISTSKNLKIASNFINKKSGCCLYYFTLDYGIPYIDMVLWKATKYKNEEEILLPRNLVAECIKINESSSPSIYYLHLCKKYDQQFDRCNTYEIVTLEPKQKEKSLKRTSSPETDVSLRLKRTSIIDLTGNDTPKKRNIIDLTL